MKQAVKKKPRISLSPKQRKLVEALSTSESVSEAGRKAGYSVPPSAHRALAAIQKRMPKILERHGLTDDWLVEKCLKPGLQAKETKFFAHEGQVIETRNVIAWNERHKYLETTYRLKGAFPKGDQGNQEVTINLGIWPHSDAVKPINSVREEPEAT